MVQNVILCIAFNIEASDRRIPAGTYDVKSYSSTKHPNVFQLMDVEGRTSILIHPGNTPDQTLGCLMPGSFTNDDYVGDSRNTFYQLRDYINQFDSFKIIILDPSGP